MGRFDGKVAFVTGGGTGIAAFPQKDEDIEFIVEHLKLQTLRVES